MGATRIELKRPAEKQRELSVCTRKEGKLRFCNWLKNGTTTSLSALGAFSETMFVFFVLKKKNIGGGGFALQLHPTKGIFS